MVNGKCTCPFCCRGCDSNFMWLGVVLISQRNEKPELEMCGFGVGLETMGGF